MSRAISVIVLASLLNTPTHAASPMLDPAQRTFGCDSGVFRELSKSTLAAVYGPKNVSKEKVIGAEGESVTYETALFAKRPDEKLLMYWRENTDKKVSGVDIFGSKWIGPVGIHVGSTIAEIEKANGKPFVFSGIGWDYGGRVKDWRGGALGPAKRTNHGGPGNFPPDCRIDVQLDSAPGAPEAAIDKVSGEKDIESNDPAATVAKIVVTKITFSYGN